MQKEYTEEFKNSILKRLKKGDTISHLSKEYHMPKKVLDELWWSLKKIKKENLGCHKKIPAYKGITEIRKGTPYESKMGGIPYIPKGEKWVICSKCKQEKVLILQLNIAELPDVSTSLREWDFVQTFACMKPSESLKDIEDEYSRFNYSMKINKMTDNFDKNLLNNCYNIAERDPRYSNDKIDGKNMNPSEPFNLYFEMKLVKRDAPTQSFSCPPWIDGYNLYVDNENQRVHSTVYNDKRTYIWAEEQCFRERVITSWEKLDDMECRYHSETLDICSGISRETTDLLGVFPSYWMRDWLEPLARGNAYDSFYDDSNDAIKEVMSCPCCNKSLTLLFQFSFTEENELILKSERKGDYNHVYALFYCEDDPEVMSCQWVGYED